jgi:hypothetical protein
MASTPTVRKQPITIHLTYNPDGTVTSTPPAQFHKDDLVEFVSDQGYEVYVKLNPHAYKPSEFTSKSHPVEVIAKPAETGATSPALCGFVKTIHGQKEAYGWVPSDVRLKLGPHTAVSPIHGIETEP